MRVIAEPPPPRAAERVRVLAAPRCALRTLTRARRCVGQWCGRLWRTQERGTPPTRSPSQDAALVLAVSPARLPSTIAVLLLIFTAAGLGGGLAYAQGAAAAPTARAAHGT
jgi:hypothetical protein